MLSKRLLGLLSLIPEDSHSLADIGADHGYLICEAFKTRKIQHALAVENKKGPYENLLSTIRAYHLENDVVASFSSGLNEVDSSYDTIVIAGMGANNIIEILEENIEKLDHIKYLIIDAHNDLFRVRQDICSKGYYLKDEKIIYEDHVYYELMLFEKGKREYVFEDYFFGPVLRRKKEPLYMQKWQKIINKYRELIGCGTLSSTRIKELEAAIRRIEQEL